MKIEEMIIAKRADCCGCEACANICPKITVDPLKIEVLPRERAKAFKFLSEALGVDPLEKFLGGDAR